MDINKVLDETAEAVKDLSALMQSVAEEKVNTAPFEGSWTPPQLLRHVAKSIKGITKALQSEYKITDRDPGQRIEELKAIFLDTTNKFKQPDFLIPEEKVYDKQSSIDELNTIFNNYKEQAQNASLNELVEGLPFGDVTKWEIIHFVLYHTQRHLRQMGKIVNELTIDNGNS